MRHIFNCIQGLIIFSVITFPPAIFLLSILGLGMVLSFFISPFSFRDSLEVFIAFFIPIVLMVACYWFCQKASWKKRGWFIYITWIFLALELCFLFCAAIGGVSQARVESKMPASYWYQQYFMASLNMTLFVQIVIIPWVFISIRLLKKIGEEKLFLNTETLNKNT